MLQYEQKYWQSGISHIAGIDEAGRGPLAGPVIAAAVILPENIHLPEVNDSKKLSPKKREKLYDEIFQAATSVGIGLASVNEIDEFNILQATYKAMQRAVGSLAITPDFLLIDGKKADVKHYKQESIIDGDEKSLSIAAASIIAKVCRDRIMTQYEIIFPGYGFAHHKGYGTKQHLQALSEKKATPIHRKSFNPVSKYLPTMAYLLRNKLIGKLGEQLAAIELLNKKHDLLEMNYSAARLGEIDIISKSENLLIFTEVKTQTAGHGWGSPSAQIDENKKNRIMNAVQYYMDTNELECDFRFDVAEVVIGKGKPQINIIKEGITGY